MAENGPDGWLIAPPPADWPAEIDTTVAHPARVYEVPPGVVYVHTWRPGAGDIVPPDGVSAYGGVAVKT